jgi:predicted PurR-regulated permease PerM
MLLAIRRLSDHVADLGTGSGTWTPSDNEPACLENDARVGEGRLAATRGSTYAMDRITNSWISCNAIKGSIMNQDPALATSEDDERAKVRKAQEVVERTSASVAQVCLIILTLLAIVYTLYFGAGIILPFVLALVVATVLGPAMRLMNRRLHIPRIIAALLLIIALFSVVGALGYALSVPAAAWIAKAPQSLPALMDKLSFLQRPIQLVEQGVHELQNTMSLSEQEPAGQPIVTVKQPSDVSSRVLGIGSTVLAGGRAFLGQGFAVMLLLFFFLASSESLLRRFVEILPRLDDKRRAVSIVTEIEDSISQYLLTISIMNALVGLLNGVAVWLLGMPDPLLFGTVAFLLNYVPILGPATGVVIFFFVGVFSFPSIWQAFIPAAIYLGIHILEGETITPMLLARRFTLNPVMVISSLMFWDWLWGIPGALLSTPLLAVTKIVCDHIEVLTPLGHMLGANAGTQKSE